MANNKHGHTEIPFFSVVKAAATIAIQQDAQRDVFPSPSGLNSQLVPAHISHRIDLNLLGLHYWHISIYLMAIFNLQSAIHKHLLWKHFIAC